ncbi:MAG: alpha/beta hydrolase [bacterium]
MRRLALVAVAALVAAPVATSCSKQRSAPRQEERSSQRGRRVAAGDAGAPRPMASASFAVDPHVELRAEWGAASQGGWRRVSFLGSAGDRIPALFRAVPEKGRFPAVILGHGHGGDKRSMADFFGGAFAGLRVHLLAVDHPFHGHQRRQGREDICASEPEVLVRRWSRAVRDLRHAVRLLRQHPRVDPKRIGYLGFSLGAVLGALTCAHEPGLAAAALISPAADWKLLAASRSTWKIGWNTRLLPRWLESPRLRRLLATVDPARTVRNFAPRPLLIVVGERDRVIRPEAGLALAEAAGRGKVLWKHPAGHGPPGTLRQRVARWLSRQLTR